MKKIVVLSLSILMTFSLSTSVITKDNLFSFFDDKQFLTAKFVQKTSLDSKERIINGTIKATRKGSFKLEYLKPIREIISADENFFYKLDLDLDQMDIVPREQYFRDTPINIFISDIEDLKMFYLIDYCEKENGVYTCSLTPKDRNSFIDNLYLTFKNNELHLLGYKDSFGQIVSIEFDEISWEDFDQSELKIAIPEGIDVVYH